mgnify:CR=1 FL=1
MADPSLATEDDIAMLRSLIKHGRTDIVTEPEDISIEDANFAYFVLEGLVLSPNDLLQILKGRRSISKINFEYIVDAFWSG